MGILKPIFKYASEQFYVSINRVRVDPRSNLDAYHRQCAQALGLSIGILLVKGDVPQVYNFRKEMIQEGELTCQKELQFLEMLFTKHPKSPSAWQHRRWCLMRLLVVGTPLCIEREQKLCSRMAEKYPKNYYAWSHRLWLLSYMSKHEVCIFSRQILL